MTSFKRDILSYARDLDQLAERVYNLRQDTNNRTKRRKLIKVADKLLELSIVLGYLA